MPKYIFIGIVIGAIGGFILGFSMPRKAVTATPQNESSQRSIVATDPEAIATQTGIVREIKNSTLFLDGGWEIEVNSHTKIEDPSKPNMVLGINNLKQGSLVSVNFAIPQRAGKVAASSVRSIFISSH